jgi:hypothetical protein
MRRALVWIVAVLLVAGAPRRAAADDGAPLVLVLGDRPELAHALHVALSPWGLEVRASADPPPADLAAAERLARDDGAKALVWVVPVAGTAVLYVFDVTNRQLLVRALVSAPPFDDARAAAVALTVKTVLRLGTLAPKEQRVDEHSTAAAAATPPAQPPAIRPASAGPWLRLESGLALRIDDQAEPRSIVGLALAPQRGRLSVDLSLSLGPGVVIDAPSFAGRHTGTTLGASVRWRATSGRVWFEPLAGLALTRATLDGVATAAELRAHVVRWNPSLVAGLVVGTRVGHIELGVGATLDMALRDQRFLIGGLPFYQVPAAGWLIGVRVAVVVP